MRLGFVGFLLLCVPIVGWLILALMLFSRNVSLTGSRAPINYRPWGRRKAQLTT